MKCQCCNHTATIHITEITNGQRIETHLCEECAQKQGIAAKNQIPLNELLSTLLAVQAEAEPGSVVGADDADSATSCPQCGISMRDFKKEGLLGCPHDYHVFGEKLDRVIEKSQGGATAHAGKIPSKAPEDTKKNVEKSQLQRDLDEAVKREDYEKAAELRDRIAELDEADGSK